MTAIDTDVRMPSEGNPVLFFVPSCYGWEKGQLQGRKWISERTSPYNDQVDFELEQVTHWCELPPDPITHAEWRSR